VTELITFTSDAKAVEVDFYSDQTLWMTDVNGIDRTWTMTIGYIDRDKYLDDDYGLYYSENMLGLAPYSTDDMSL